MRGSLHRLLVALGIGCLGASVALASPPGAKGTTSCVAPEVHVYKREGALELVCSGAVRRTMAVTFGGSPVGPKEREGDQRTPEGRYRISSKVRSARFHLFLGVSYPNVEDRRRARERGITRPGSGIGIHGTRARLAGMARLWTRVASATGMAGVWGPTDGCIALTNEDVELLWRAVPVGTPVIILPARPAPPVAPPSPPHPEF